MPEHVIKFSSGNRFLINESADLDEIQRICWKFFKTPHGKRETFTVYRGQLIVRNTVKFTGCKSERRTTVYLYLAGALEDVGPYTPNLFCVSSGNQCGSTHDAEALIDRIIKEKRYAYDMNKEA